MCDLPEKHNLIIFIFRFKFHYFGNVRIFGTAFVIFAGELKRIHKQFVEYYCNQKIYFYCNRRGLFSVIPSVFF